MLRVIDGDTVELERLGIVRLIGIDTPESVDPRQPVQHFALEAVQYTKERLLGKTVRLEYEYPRHDRYGRTLAYLYVDDTIEFNAAIIRDGYAFADVEYPFQYMEEFMVLEREAREHGRGLWSDEAQLSLPDYVLPGNNPSSTTAEILELTSPVSAGGNAKLVVKTEPNQSCEVQLIYGSGPSDSKDLSARSAGPDGIVVWEWMISGRTSPGDWPLRVSCNQGQVSIAKMTVQ